MDGYIGEVKLFAGSFAPRSWAFCDGRSLEIRRNSALHSIIGTIYGGDGKTHFALPDLRGRCALGVGSGPSLTDRNIGQHFGSESEVLTTSQLPSHQHDAKFSDGSAKLYTSSALGTAKQPSPGDAISTEAGGTTFLYGAGDPDVEMDFGSIQDVSGTVTTEKTGGNQPHSTMQPSLVINYIICVQGIVPASQ